MPKESYKCEQTHCEQMIILISRPTQIINYQMTAQFTIRISNSFPLAATTNVFVVIKRSKFQKNPPEFINLPYRFFVSESLTPGRLARNVSIVTREVHDLSVYDSGFSLDLLNQDLTFADDVFEIVPNYGEGLVVSTFKLKDKALLDYEKGKRRYDLVVKQKWKF